MDEISISVKSIEGKKLSDETNQDSQVLFDVDVSMTEGERNAESTLLNFTMTLESEPPAAKLVMSGTARIKGKEEEIEAMLRSTDEKSVPPLFMRIYQKVYSIMYLLCGSLDIPYPSPGLLKLTHLESTAPITHQIRA